MSTGTSLSPVLGSHGERSGSLARVITTGHHQMARDTFLSSLQTLKQSAHLPDGATGENLSLLLGEDHVAFFLKFVVTSNNGEVRTATRQCLASYAEAQEFFDSCSASLEIVDQSDPVVVFLTVQRMEPAIKFVDQHESSEEETQCVKPVILCAAEQEEWDVVGTILIRRIALDTYSRAHFSRSIIAHICLCCSEELLDLFLHSEANIGLDFSMAMDLAYERQRCDVTDFLLSLDLSDFGWELRRHDCRLAIHRATYMQDEPFLKYLHERGVDAGKLVAFVSVDAVPAFLTRCFALPYAHTTSSFAYQRATVYSSFVPACIEGLIKTSRSPLTCINFVLKSRESPQHDPAPIPNLKFLFTHVMRSVEHDATLLKLLLQFWLAAKRASRRVEEEREDLLRFCTLIEQVVLEVFACDSTTKDEHLLPLIRMSRNASATSARIPLASENDMRWIFTTHSIIQHCLAKKFKVIFAVPQVNRLVLQIFDSSRSEYAFLHSSFQERFFPQILFFVEMAMRVAAFVIIGFVSVGYYSDKRPNVFDNPHRFVEFHPAEVLLVFFLVAEICHEFGEILETRRSGMKQALQQSLLDRAPLPLRGGADADEAVADDAQQQQPSSSAQGDADSVAETRSQDSERPSVFRRLSQRHYSNAPPLRHYSNAPPLRHYSDAPPLRHRRRLSHPFATDAHPDAGLNDADPDPDHDAGDSAPAATAQIADNEYLGSFFFASGASHSSAVDLQAQQQTGRGRGLSAVSQTDAQSDAAFSQFDTEPRAPLHLQIPQLSSPHAYHPERRFTRTAQSRGASLHHTHSNYPLLQWMLELRATLLAALTPVHLQPAAQSTTTSKQPRVRKREVLREYFRDDWNFVDVINSALGLVWFFLRLVPSQFLAARVTLCVLAIPWCIGLLRYFSVRKTLGELVIIIKEMVRDLGPFLVVYIVVSAGFQTAFRGVFYTQSSFSTSGITFLSLFSATMGNFDFGDLGTAKTAVSTLGILLLILFVVLTAILLINLLIARMSNSFQRISDASQMEWAFERAKLVMTLTLIREKPVWSILPPPLNLFPIVGTLGGRLDDEWRARAHASQATRCLSLRGTLANLTLFFVYFPCAKLAELAVGFARTFILSSEEPISTRAFLRLCADTVFYLVIYVPLFLVEIARSLLVSDWELRPWISHVTVDDEYLLPKRSAPPALQLDRAMSASATATKGRHSLSGADRFSLDERRSPRAEALAAAAAPQALSEVDHLQATPSPHTSWPHPSADPAAANGANAAVDVIASSSAVYAGVQRIFTNEHIEQVLRPFMHTTHLPQTQTKSQTQTESAQSLAQAVSAQQALVQQLQAELQTVRAQQQQQLDLLHQLLRQTHTQTQT